MTKDFIISTIAEIEGYPCDNMIGNVDIAEFMNEKCDKWCKKHCAEHNKKKCWKKFFKEWYKAEKEKQLKLLESAGVSLETAEKVLQMSLFDNQPEVKQMSIADMSIDDILKLDESNKDHDIIFRKTRCDMMIEDIAKIISNIEEMNNLITPEQKNFDSEVNRMSVFDAFNETVNEFFEKIYLESNKESLKKMIDDGKVTPDCVVIMNGEHKPSKRVFDKLNIPIIFDNCMETDKALIVTDKETVRVLKNMADFENPAENTPRKWLVVVKHFEDNSGREFTFESEKAVEKGDMVLVKTKYGESMAKVKNVYEVTGNPELILFVANAIGVKNITGKVIDVYVKKNETK